MQVDNSRRHFRIVYPWEERPRFVIGNSICEVLDCSERGLRFRLPETPYPSPGDEIHGKLRLPRGNDVLISGVVVRVEAEGEIALELSDPGVSFYLILKEQIHLRKREWEPEEHSS